MVVMALLLTTGPMKLLGSSLGPTLIVFCALDQLLDEVVVNLFRHDRAGARGALLPLITKGGLHYAFHGGFDVGFFIHDDGIFAAHLEDGALDPLLARHGFAC